MQLAMQKSKRFPLPSKKMDLSSVPAGIFDGGIKEPAFAAKFGEMASLWPHIEDKMIDVLTELLGGDYGLPSRQIYRSIISPQARIKVLRSLLERTEMNQRKDKIYDEILNEFASLNNLRNTYLHGLWHTHEGGRVFFIEASVDETSLFENREVKIEEIVSAIGKMTDLEDRISDLIDGEQEIREAQST
jgi:hypothetical protein